MWQYTIFCCEQFIFIIIIIIINDVLDYEIYIAFDTTLFMYKPHYSFGGHISLFAILINVYTRYNIFLALDILSLFFQISKK